MEKPILTVDRIENDIAVCEKEDGNMIDMKLTQIIGKVVEGDVLSFTKEGYKVNTELTKKRKECIESALKEMWE